MGFSGQPARRLRLQVISCQTSIFLVRRLAGSMAHAGLGDLLGLPNAKKALVGGMTPKADGRSSLTRVGH